MYGIDVRVGMLCVYVCMEVCILRMYVCVYGKV